MKYTSCFVDVLRVYHQTEEEREDDGTSSRASSDEPNALFSRVKWTHTAGRLAAKIFWGTGRNWEDLGGTWRAKQLSLNTCHIESFHLSREWIWHIPWWHILQYKYCPWEVCCSAEVNIKLALGCIRFPDVAVRAEMQAWWFLRVQEGTGDGLGHMFHPSGRCVICASAWWVRTGSTLQGLRLPVGALSGTWYQSSLFLSVKFHVQTFSELMKHVWPWTFHKTNSSYT